jgi:hypothetical protein
MQGSLEPVPGALATVDAQPRIMLARPGAKVKEMHRHEQFGTCCGAGGGRMWIEEDADERVNLLRTDQALAPVAAVTPPTTWHSLDRIGTRTGGRCPRAPRGAGRGRDGCGRSSSRPP